MMSVERMWMWIREVSVWICEYLMTLSLVLVLLLSLVLSLVLVLVLM
jgi:hypothetical protein